MLSNSAFQSSYRSGFSRGVRSSWRFLLKSLLGPHSGSQAGISAEKSRPSLVPVYYSEPIWYGTGAMRKGAVPVGVQLLRRYRHSRDDPVVEDAQPVSPPGKGHPGFEPHTLNWKDRRSVAGLPSEAHIAEARDAILQKEGFIIDMDGVIYHGNKILLGVKEFVEYLQRANKRFLFLTNSSDKTPEELQQKLARLGIDVETSHFYTSALATAAFLSSQRPGGTAYVIGEPGLLKALYQVGYSMNSVNPDYVVVGETPNYTYDKIEHAVHCILNGAKLIATNCDKTDPSPTYPGEVIPAAGSLITPIEKASNINAYFVGKPNPLMMRSALASLGVKRRDAIIIGDRMDTDVLGGLEASIDSCLVLSGVTSLQDMRQYSFMPRFVIRGLSDLVTPPANSASLE